MILESKVGKDLKKEEYGMKEVNWEKVEGYIYIWVEEEEKDFEDLRNMVENYIEKKKIKEEKVEFER